MKAGYTEGLRVSLVEEGFLDGFGILHTEPNSSKSYGLPTESIQLFLAIAAAGSGGLLRSHVPKPLREDLTTHLLPLELQNLVEWETAKNGVQTYMVLTWRGQEAMDAARPKAPSRGSANVVNIRRKHSLQ